VKVEVCDRQGELPIGYFLMKEEESLKLLLREQNLCCWMREASLLSELYTYDASTH
jgi:hypothetical protein